MKQAERTIFVVGCPRSGTTIFTKILSFHPLFAYPNQYINKYPSHPELSLLSKIYDISYIGNFFRKNSEKIPLLPIPYEAWEYYGYLDDLFCPSDRSSINVQKEMGLASNEARTKFINSFNILKKYQGKKNIVVKWTDKPRIIYTDSIFPDSQFIHITRDGKAVVNSLYNNVIKKGWIDEVERSNWINTYHEDWKNCINESNDKIISFLAFFYIDHVTKINRQMSFLEEHRKITIEYEKLIESPIDTMKEVLKYVKIEWDDSYESFIQLKKLVNQNDKYKSNLTHNQIDIINSILNRYQSNTALENEV